MKKIICAALSALMALSFMTACSAPNPAVSPVSSLSPEKESLPFTITTVSAPEYTITEEELFSYSDNIEALSNHISAFGLDLASRIDQDTFIVSPYSVYLAMAAVMEGASGTTEQEMAELLIPQNMNQEDFRQSIKAMLQQMSADQTGSIIDVNTLATISNQFEIDQEFSDVIRDYYNGTTASGDFSNPQTTEDLNQWAKEKTNGLIDPLLSDPLDPQAVMVLLNSVYFLGQWANPFEEAQNYDGSFYGKNETTQQTFMTQSGDYQYIDTETYQSVKLNYNGIATMSLFLPKEGKTTADVITALQKSQPEYQLGRGTVSLPKFEADTELPLNDILKDTGLTSVFAGGLTDIAQNEDLFISNVFQKAKVTVDEKGTEAAAVTQVEIAKSAYLEPETNFTFTADHPFVYTIDAGSTNLFIGVQSGF